MNNITRLACWISLGLLAMCPAGSAAETKVLFEDKFDTKIGDGWSWVREDSAAWRIKDKSLQIRVQPGVADTVKSALVREAPDRSKGKFAIEVTITSLKKPVQQYEQAGITWYRSGKPVFKLVKELVSGKVLIIPGAKPMTNDTVQLRLIVNGDSFTAQFRPDSKGEFQTAAEGNLPPSSGDQVSIQCYNGPAGEEHWIKFDDFRITELKE